MSSERQTRMNAAWARVLESPSTPNRTIAREAQVDPATLRRMRKVAEAIEQLDLQGQTPEAAGWDIVRTAYLQQVEGRQLKRITDGKGYQRSLERWHRLDREQKDRLNAAKRERYHRARALKDEKASHGLPNTKTNKARKSPSGESARSQDETMEVIRRQYCDRERQRHRGFAGQGVHDRDRKRPAKLVKVEKRRKSSRDAE